MYRLKVTKNGFTLIELLVVISIISLLSSVVLSALNNTREKARITAAQQQNASILHAVGDQLLDMWGFDDCPASGTTRDDSGAGKTATLVSTSLPSPMNTPLGKGCSLSFGGGSYVLTPLMNSLSPTSVTLSAWVKSNASGGVVFSELGQAAINTGYHDSQIEISNNTGVIKMCVYSSGSRCVTGSSSFTYGVWHYVVLAYDASKNTLYGYVDGVPGGKATGIVKDYPSDHGFAGVYYGIGAADGTNQGNGAYFSGLIDDVRVYGASFTAMDVARMYAEGRVKYTDIAVRQ